METSPVAGALDPDLVLDRLRASRLALLRTLLVARAGIAAALLVTAHRGGSRGGSWWVDAAFAAYLAWAVATGVRAHAAPAAVVRAPGWLWLEQGLCVGLVVLGGGARVLTLYLCALPVIFATVFLGRRLGLALATADAILVAGILGGATLAGVSVGTEPVRGTEWPPALVGLYVAVGLFTYVRRLFTELERTGVAYRRRSRDIAESVTAEARMHARAAAFGETVSRLERPVADVCARVVGLRGHRPADPRWSEECAALERLADLARTSLDELSESSTVHTPDVVLVDDVLSDAVERVRETGSLEVDVRTSGCDVPVPLAAREALARFVEEALWNAHKHGRPPITVGASAAAGMVMITVGDHGDGFRPGSPSRRFGLQSLRRDAELLRGHLRIVAEPGAPVSVVLTFPAGDA